MSRILWPTEQLVQQAPIEAVRGASKPRKGRAKPVPPETLYSPQDVVEFTRFGNDTDHIRFRRHGQMLANSQQKPFSILNFSRKRNTFVLRIRPWRVEHELNGEGYLVEVIQPQAA
jgi:hypothetical protein